MPSARDESANLDLLRSTAVLLVLVNHVLLFLRQTHDGMFLRPMGRLGVLLFFAHTSLVLMLSLERQASFRYAHPYWVFLTRRCFRIYPLAVLAVGLVWLFRLPLGSFEYGAFLPASFDALTLSSNFLLVQNLTSVESVLDPLWSLPYEMQMYLALPALFALCMAARGFRSLPARLLPLLGLWALAAVTSRVVQANFGSTLLDFVPSFLAGVIAYQLWAEPRRWPAFGWPLWLGVAVLGYLSHPGLRSGWLCCLFVAWGATQFREQSFKPLRQVCQWIARYSYGIYLSHGICIWFAFDKLAHWPTVPRWALFVGLTTLVPVILYHAVEAPMIGLGGRLVRRFAKQRELVPSSLPVPSARLPA